MITKWHISIYWYTIAVMILLLIFLLIPDQYPSKSNSNQSKDAKLSKLADDYAQATTSSERAQTSHRYQKLMKSSQSVRGGQTNTLVPVKIVLLAAMVFLLYNLIKDVRTRRKNRQALRRT